MKKSFVFWSSVKPLQSVCVLFVKLLLWNVVTLKLFGRKVNARIPVFSTFSTLSHQKWPHFGTIQNVNWRLDRLNFLETFWNLVFRDLLPEKTLETRFTFIFGQNFQKSFQFQKRCRRKSRFLIHIPAHAAVSGSNAGFSVCMSRWSLIMLGMSRKLVCLDFCWCLENPPCRMGKYWLFRYENFDVLFSPKDSLRFCLVAAL